MIYDLDSIPKLSIKYKKYDISNKDRIFIYHVILSEEDTRECVPAK